ncbi:MAG: hypothetical protein K2H01_03150, partial [Ruminococcus sp.]|nr:hypothetical protein [Ruminococcus sp.]
GSPGIVNSAFMLLTFLSAYDIIRLLIFHIPSLPTAIGARVFIYLAIVLTVIIVACPMQVTI